MVTTQRSPGLQPIIQTQDGHFKKIGYPVPIEIASGYPAQKKTTTCPVLHRPVVRLLRFLPCVLLDHAWELGINRHHRSRSQALAEEAEFVLQISGPDLGSLIQIDQKKPKGNKEMEISTVVNPCKSRTLLEAFCGHAFWTFWPLNAKVRDFFDKAARQGTARWLCVAQFATRFSVATLGQNVSANGIPLISKNCTIANPRKIEE